jgi:hypothetical protein
MFVALFPAMKSGTSFLLAARQCEIAELEQLARTSELVGVIGRFVHALQRERGISNIFLSSQGARFADQRGQQAEACRTAEQEVRVAFERLDTRDQHVRNGSRLFSRVAVVLHALEALPELRERIARQRLGAPEATAAFGKLVAGLLAVVFEAADAATDPPVSRALVAMFNFMQGKEFAGQERAFGARAFAAGQIDAAGQQQWQHLVAAQQGCLAVFTDFAEPDVLQAERTSQDAAALAKVERLRHIGCGGTSGVLDPELSQIWYEHCTRRIDGMKLVEDLLATRLRGLCERRIAQARAELRDQRAMLQALSSEARAADAAGAAHYGPHLERSILAMVQEQSRRLQAMSDELDEARASLNERKVVERAKGLLMAHRQMNEDDAYKALRQMAMNQNRRLADVAAAVLSLADVLPGTRR